MRPEFRIELRTFESAWCYVESVDHSIEIVIRETETGRERRRLAVPFYLLMRMLDIVVEKAEGTAG